MSGLRLPRMGQGFWTVAYAFLVVTAFATLPSPLYGLYRARDHLAPLTITVVFGIFTSTAIAVLVVVPRVAARIGRRGVMLTAVVTMVLASALLAVWHDLPGLLLGRLLTGVSVGLATGTAITYLIELRLRAAPEASVVKARNIGTAVNVGALGLGPLVGGILASWVAAPLTTPYLLFLALGLVAAAGVTTVPETGARPAPLDPPAAPAPRARLPVPAAAATMTAFSANGLFAGLCGLLLATTLGQPAPALAGLTLFFVFSSGVASQLATGTRPPPQVLRIGTASMLLGLLALVVAVRIATPNLGLFLLGGALIGAGAGAVFKGTTGLVIDGSPPQSRLAMTSALLISLFLGLSVPVIGVGIALNLGVSAPDTLLWFAILVAVGVTASGWALLGRGTRRPATTG